MKKKTLKKTLGLSSLILLIVAVFCYEQEQCEPSSQQEQNKSPINTKFIWGGGTHLLNRENNSAFIPLVQTLGMRSFRDDASWGAVEKSPAIYSFPSAWDQFINGSISADIKPLLIIDYGNKFYGNNEKPISEGVRYAYVKYAETLVNHYKGRVQLYEIWNEWDTKEPKSPAAYVQLLKETYLAIKAIDSDAIVLGAGIGPHSMQKGLFDAESWLEEFVRIGGLQYLDGLSVHPYVHCAKDPSPDGFLELLQQMTIATSSRVGLPIYITEMGWPSHTGACGVSQEKVRDYMIEAFLIAKCLPQVKGLWWYDLIDDGADLTDREHNFGIYDVNLRPKKAYQAAVKIGQMNDEISCEKPITGQKDLALYQVKPFGSMNYNDLLQKLRH